jgi:hypothetical protein
MSHFPSVVSPAFRRHSLLSARLLFCFLVELQSASCPIRVEGKKKRSHLAAERSSPNSHGIFQTRDIHGLGQIQFKVSGA